MTSGPQPDACLPPQEYARGGRQARDSQWLAYVTRQGPPDNGRALLIDERFVQGVSQFNAGNYYEAHESFEAVWGAYPYPERLFSQALTKIAAALVHAGRANYVGARRLASAGLALLLPFAPRFAGLDVRKFAKDVQALSESAGKGEASNNVVTLKSQLVSQQPLSSKLSSRPLHPPIDPSRRLGHR